MARNIVSWNVNGIRAVHRKGLLLPFMEDTAPDILCLQETKASPEQLPQALREIEGYTSFFSSAEKRGYSGTALYTKEEPQSVEMGFGKSRFDGEGRTIKADYGDFLLYNVYFPNGGASPERLRYKLDFYDAFLSHLDSMREQGRKIIVTGDVNTAHKEIDLARPRENETNTGFLPEERAWIDEFLSHGFLDSFRIYKKEGGHYSWWDYKTRARERNVGWRLDYFFISEDLASPLNDSYIMSDIIGSDHCPVAIKIEI